VLNLGFHLPDRLLGQVTQLCLRVIAGMPVGEGQPESTGGGGRFLFATVLRLTLRPEISTMLS
jgi:hypothetical protein